MKSNAVGEQARELAGHTVVSGLDGLAFRVVEELRRLGEEVVVVSDAPAESLAEGVQDLGAVHVEGNCRAESVLRAAGVSTAEALVILNDDDVGNLHTALAARELNPHLRIVLRMFNLELGRRIESLFHDCTVLSSSAIAAPAFVSAALHEDWAQRVEVGGHTLAVRQANPGEEGLLLPLARVPRGGPVEFFPTEGDDLLCLVDEGPSDARLNVDGRQTTDDRRRTSFGRLRSKRFNVQTFKRFNLGTVVAFVRGADRRLRYLLLVLLALVLVSTLTFAYFRNLAPVDALYFTVTIMTTTGFGDINLLDAPQPLKLFGIGLMLLGAATLTLFYALVTDALVSSRLAHMMGTMPVHMQDHVVVCGLGNIGYRVVEQLTRAGVPVAATELNEDNRFLPLARRLRVPVLVADASLPETLVALNVAKARCLVAATDDDAANLETALTARSLHPGIRVVLRLFDPDLAEHVQKAFDINISRSPSALAAPTFAAAAVGQRVIATISTGRRVLVVANLQLDPGSWAEGKRIEELEADMEVRVLAISTDGRVRWRPPTDTLMAPDQELVVVATRQGLAQALAGTRSDEALQV